jgi:hypothetical protein
MTAISIGCENPGGNVGIVNNTPATGDYSVGLFQINYYQGLADSRTKEYGSAMSLANSIQKQAAAAWSISSQGTNWSPWGNDFGNDCDYRKAVPAATVAVAKVTAMSAVQRTASLANLGDTATAAGTPGSTPSSLAGSDGGVTPDTSSACLIRLPSVAGIGGGCLFRTSWLRAIGGGAMLGAGGLVIMVAAVLMVKGSKSLPRPAKTAVAKLPGATESDYTQEQGSDLSPEDVGLYSRG